MKVVSLPVSSNEGMEIMAEKLHLKSVVITTVLVKIPVCDMV
jgi:hypothetical protein